MLATLLGPLACLTMGTAGLFAPRAFGSQTGLTAVGPLGRSELRALFGGVFVGLSIACLVLGTPSAYWAVAAAFFGGGSGTATSPVFAFAESASSSSHARFSAGRRLPE